MLCLLSPSFPLPFSLSLSLSFSTSSYSRRTSPLTLFNPLRPSTLILPTSKNSGPTTTGATTRSYVGMRACKVVLPSNRTLAQDRRKLHTCHLTAITYHIYMYIYIFSFFFFFNLLRSYFFSSLFITIAIKHSTSLSFSFNVFSVNLFCRVHSYPPFLLLTKYRSLLLLRIVKRKSSYISLKGYSGRARARQYFSRLSSRCRR